MGRTFDEPTNEPRPWPHRVQAAAAPGAKAPRNGAKSPMKNGGFYGRKNGAFYSIENGGLHRWNQPIVASTIEGLQCTSLATKTLPASMRHSRKVSERTLKKLPNARAWLCPRKRQHIPSIHGWTINFLSLKTPKKKERQPTSVQSPLKLSSNESSSHVSPFPDFQIFIVQWPSFSRGTQPFHLVGCHSSHAAGASDARQGHGLNKPCSLILGWRVTPIVN